MTKKLLSLIASLFFMAALGTTAHAGPIGLSLVIDGSGSIGSSDFTTQKNAYANVLSTIPADGTLAVGVYQFSASVVTEYAFQTIDDVADRDALVAAINAMSQLGSLTAIGDGINTATDDMVAYGIGNLDKAIIDVSTDGVNNTGANPNTAADDAITAGINAVNCLGIGASANCGFIAGTGSFAVTATFDTLEQTLRDKIGRETGIGVPVPGTLLIMGAGLLGFGARRRFA